MFAWFLAMVLRDASLRPALRNELWAFLRRCLRFFAPLFDMYPELRQATGWETQ